MRILKVVMMHFPIGATGPLEGVLDELVDMADSLLRAWDCPELEKIDESLLEKFPGYSRYPGMEMRDRKSSESERLAVLYIPLYRCTVYFVFKLLYDTNRVLCLRPGDASCQLVIAGRVIAICPMASGVITVRTSPNDPYRQGYPQSADKRTVSVGFDAASQYVSTTGVHAFVPPGLGDFCGPCPGWNAMANHGYIPHNGIATINEYVQVFGMSKDLALFLGVFGVSMDGDIPSLSFSIGKVVNSILGLLPQNGLTGSHNNYEGDVSPTRGDLCEYNNYELQMSQFLQLYDLQFNVSNPSQVNYDMDLLTSFRLSRFQQSIEKNHTFSTDPSLVYSSSPPHISSFFASWRTRVRNILN
ncbi:Chloroperoxidase [Lentinula edodes]|nr:Chloroperoxidase [Lentinula edodes]